METFILTVFFIALFMAISSLATPILRKWSDLLKSNFRIVIPKKDLTYYKGIKQTQLTPNEYISKKGL